MQKVEDEIDCNSPIVGFRRKIGRSAYAVREGNRIITVSERASRGGSLQNIFHAASSAEFETHHISGKLAFLTGPALSRVSDLGLICVGRNSKEK